jgi:hypothetical protein
MIGRWAARFAGQKGEKRLTQYHYVESEIMARVVTNCGREMERKTKSGRLVALETLTQIGELGDDEVCDLCR